MDYVFLLQLGIACVVAGSTYALIGTGMNLVYGTLRLLNVAHGEMVMLGAYTALVTVTAAGISPLFALPLAMGLCGFLAWAGYRTVFQKMFGASRSADRMEANSLLVLFGLSVILQNVVSLSFTATPRAYRYLDMPIEIVPGVQVLGSRLLTLVIGLVVVGAIILFFRITRTGLAIRALIQGRETCPLLGIDVDRLSIVSAALGFGLGGLAGVLISMSHQVDPFMGFSYTVSGFVIVMLGGLGNLPGGLVAGMLLGVLETFGTAVVGPSFRSILIYGTLVAVLMIRPTGLLSGAGSR